HLYTGNKSYLESAASLNVWKLTRRRNWIMEKMEKLLVICIEDNSERNLSMSQMAVQEKASSIFEISNTGDTDESTENVIFQASQEKFEKLKGRFNWQNLMMTVESAGATSKEYPNI
ncbi:hypothetical protein HHI36_022954, partial [Cryptolaemus montrouzieri]